MFRFLFQVRALQTFIFFFRLMFSTKHFLESIIYEMLNVSMPHAL